MAMPAFHLCFSMYDLEEDENGVDSASARCAGLEWSVLCLPNCDRLSARKHHRRPVNENALMRWRSWSLSHSSSDGQTRKSRRADVVWARGSRVQLHPRESRQGPRVSPGSCRFCPARPCRFLKGFMKIPFIRVVKFPVCFSIMHSCPNHLPFQKDDPKSCLKEEA